MIRALAASLLLVACPAFAWSADDEAEAPLESKLGRPSAVEFDGEHLDLAFEAENDNDAVTEYLPQGENLEKWTKLAAYYEFPKLDDPRAYGDAVRAQLKEQYPLCPSAMFTDPKTGDVIVDFTVWPEDGSFVEFNVWRYRKQEKGGLLAEQYAVRDYDDVEAFLKDLSPLRKRLLDEMAAKGLTPAEHLSDVERETTTAAVE